MPADSPLLPIRQMVNKALIKMDGLFTKVDEADAPALRQKNCCVPLAPSVLPHPFGTTVRVISPVQPALPLVDWSGYVRDDVNTHGIQKNREGVTQ